MKEKVLLIFIGIILSVATQTIADTIISSNSVNYINSKTNETTVEGSLDELFSAVDINNRLGDTNKISSIGDGTVSGAISALNTSLAGKQATITGGATTIASTNLTASRALVSNGSGKVAVSGVTSTELGYLDGVTGNVQTQINTINNTLSNIGTIVSKSETITVTPDHTSIYTGASITLPVGKWIITRSVHRASGNYSYHVDNIRVGINENRGNNTYCVYVANSACTDIRITNVTSENSYNTWTVWEGVTDATTTFSVKLTTTAIRIG